MTRRKWITLVVLLPLLGGLVWFGCALHHCLYVTVPDAYAVWNVASLVNDYMDAHDGAWPHGWDDLRRTYEASNLPNPKHMADLQARVAVDWGADPRLLRAARPNGDKPPFKVIWLRDGSSAHWSGAEPNTLVWEHLQQPPATTQTRPALNPAGAEQVRGR